MQPRLSFEVDERIDLSPITAHAGFLLAMELFRAGGAAGLKLLQWHRGKAGTFEHTHRLPTTGVAAEALPSQKFVDNGSWLGLNVPCHNLIPPLKRVALPETFS